MFWFIFRYGELVNINMVRDKVTGKTKGFCFICYQDQRSTDLAVDNFNGIKVSVSSHSSAGIHTHRANIIQLKGLDVLLFLEM